MVTFFPSRNQSMWGAGFPPRISLLCVVGVEPTKKVSLVLSTEGVNMLVLILNTLTNWQSFALTPRGSAWPVLVTVCVCMCVCVSSMCVCKFERERRQVFGKRQQLAINNNHRVESSGGQNSNISDVSFVSWVDRSFVRCATIRTNWNIEKERERQKRNDTVGKPQIWESKKWRSFWVERAARQYLGYELARFERECLIIRMS